MRRLRGTAFVSVIAHLTLPRSAGLSFRRIWIACLVLTTLAYYFWTLIISAGVMPRIRVEERDHFNLLSHGFLKGQLHLDHEVPTELITAKNPYDPALRE